MDKQLILENIYEYATSKLDVSTTEIKVSGVRITPADFVAVVNALLDAPPFTEGNRCKELTIKISKYLNVRHTLLCNSGSSANLLAVTSAKEYWKVPDGRRVITSALAFPTTVAPIIQNNLVPLFVDVDLHTLNPDIDTVLSLLERNNVCGVILAHTLGFPYDACAIRSKADMLRKFFIEDNCDALGAKVYGQMTGSIGHISTLSMFPAHHITTGEGGAVSTDDTRLFNIIRSYSNWGRSCVCKPGESNVCGKRFTQEYTNLPDGFDHKYVFERLGYNLKITELQAALGLSQFSRIEDVISTRRIHYYFLKRSLYLLDKKGYFFFVDVPEFSVPSPFGFPISVNSSSPFTKNEIVAFLEENNIRTRPIFSGNIIRHPMMEKVKYEKYGFDDELWSGCDYAMNTSFWIGCQDALSTEQLKYVVDKFEEFLEKYK